MNRWQTIIPIHKSKFQASLGSTFYSIGSCFSQHLANALRENLFDVYTSPFGIEYNMMSILTGLKRILIQDEFTTNDLVTTPQNLITTWHHHKTHFQTTPEKALENLNQSLHTAHHKIKNCDFICLTLGTAFLYERQDSQQIVNNCHRMPASQFRRRVSTIEETLKLAIPIFEEIQKLNPKVHWVLSLSPVKHLRDDPTENSLSKSICRIVLNEICQHFPHNTYYFPAYEIMTDELRDYRFYDSHMTHPSQEAIEYIQERFFTIFMDTSVQSFLKEWSQIQKFFHHRPNETHSEEYQKVLNSYKDKVFQLKKQYPMINLDFFETNYL